MEIKTRFALGDKVWALHNGKAVEFEILTISISRPMAALPHPAICYTGIVGSNSYVNANEDNCFATKQQLMDYAFGD